MRLQIDGNPDYGHLRVGLTPGERFLAEGGAMTWMDTGVTIKARLLGGFLRALIRKLTGGESLFVGEYATDNGGEVVFSPASPGMVVQRTMRGGLHHADRRLILCLHTGYRAEYQVRGSAVGLFGRGALLHGVQRYGRALL